jgi:hypothetical protein
LPKYPITDIAISYICEISPPSKRGPLTSGPQLLITLGLVVGFFTCYGTSNINSSLSWRLPFIFLSGLAFTFSAAALLWLIPSPRWLSLHGRTAEAAETWDFLGVSHADREKLEIAEEEEEQRVSVEIEEPVRPAGSPSDKDKEAQVTTRPVESHHKGGFWALFARDVRARSIFAIFLMGMQQLSGIDGVLYVRVLSIKNYKRTN